MYVLFGTELETGIKNQFQLFSWFGVLLWRRVANVHCAKKATIHQVTTMLATSKNVLFLGHKHLLTTGTDDPWHSVQICVCSFLDWMFDVSDTPKCRSLVKVSIEPASFWHIYMLLSVLYECYMSRNLVTFVNMNVFVLFPTWVIMTFLPTHHFVCHLLRHCKFWSTLPCCYIMMGLCFGTLSTVRRPGIEDMFSVTTEWSSLIWSQTYPAMVTHLTVCLFWQHHNFVQAQLCLVLKTTTTPTLSQ